MSRSAKYVVEKGAATGQKFFRETRAAHEMKETKRRYYASWSGHTRSLHEDEIGESCTSIRNPKIPNYITCSSLFTWDISASISRGFGRKASAPAVAALSAISG